MLETEFFPTPVAVVRKMVSPLIRKWEDLDYERLKCDGIILDPQGGAGDILDYLVDKLNVNKSDIYTIEIDPELRLILQGKGYKVVGTDFLEYHELCAYDLIIMNPPFSEGVKHVLKGWEVLNDGGNLVSLLNAQTLKNPFSQEREYLLHLLATMIGKSFNVATDSVEELLELLEQNNIIEWLGSCFKNAERPTDVEVVIIRLHKPKSESSNPFEGIQFDLDKDFIADGFSPNPLAQRDIIKNLVARYDALARVLRERYELQFKINFYLQGISQPVYETDEYQNANSLINNVSLHEQILVLKSRFWNTVFEKTELGLYTPTDFQQKFKSIRLNNSSLAFTEHNVREVLMTFALNINQFMMDSLIKVFEEASQYHEDNRTGNGWVTNKSWMLNKKVIMPGAVTYDTRWNSFSISHYRQGFLGDFDKVLCWLSGKKYPAINHTYETISTFCEQASRTKQYEQDFYSEFFRIRIYKKGTMHLHFLDETLWRDFNRKVAQGKNWMGSQEPFSS